MEHISAAPYFVGWDRSLLANIRLGWEGFLERNTALFGLFVGDKKNLIKLAKSNIKLAKKFSSLSML